MIAGLLLVGLAFGWEAERAPGVPESTQTLLATAQGGAVALTRYARPGAVPVLLCHGISSNHHFWDLGPERSLAQALYLRGYDVWSLDLRGHGDARRGAEGDRLERGFTIDEYGRVDLPAALALVRQESGGQDVHFVGHSMAGMVLAVMLSTQGDAGLASASLVGSPLDFRDPDVMLAAAFGLAPTVMGAMASLPTPMVARSVGFWGRAAPLQLDAFLHNPENMGRKAERLMWKRVVSPVHAGEAKQFAAMGADGVFRSADGAVDYVAGLAESRLPTLLIAGRLDRLVAPDRVIAYREAMPLAEVRFEVMGRADGAHADYGHLDLGVGDHAAEDVYPLVFEWIEAHR